MVNRKTFREEVALVRRTVLEALPTGVSFAAIIVALAEVLKMIQEQCLDDES